MNFKEKFIVIALETIDTVLNIVITLAIVFFIRTFIFSPFLISGVSMYPTLSNSEYILVNKITYGNIFGYQVNEPKRKDIVVVKAPLVNREDTVYYIKRVIGLPGDTLRFEGESVFLKERGDEEFVKLDENYIRCEQQNRKCSKYTFPENEDTFLVPEDSYFVMGDNRDQSTDSRSCFYSCSLNGSTNYVKREGIIGKASVVLWPFAKARFIEEKNIQ